MIQRLSFAILFSIFACGAMAQLVESFPPTGSPVIKKNKIQKRVGDKTTQCGIDTLYYSRHNLSGTTPRFLNLSSGGTISGAGMFFAVDDTVKLYGFNFYSYILNGFSFGTQNVTCKVYKANQNKLPTGTALASGTYTITASNTTLSQLRQKFLFSSPVVVTSNFVVAFEFVATTNNTVNIASNNYDSLDGLGKKYTCIKFQTGGWSNNLNVGGVAYDADFFMEPVVSYKMTANYDHGDNSCLGNGNAFKFINTTTFATNPQFSREVIDSTMDDNFIWDYGDFSPEDTVFNGEHYYTGTLGYSVKLSGSFVNWRGNTCNDDTTIFLEPNNIVAKFKSEPNGLIVAFTDQSTGATSWEWDFGDGSNGSVLDNPTHQYAKYGKYQVKHTAKYRGCKDEVLTLLDLKEVDYTGLTDHSNNTFSVVTRPNPASDRLYIQTTLKSDDEAKWFLFSIQGAELASGILHSNDEINLSDYRSGVYFMRFERGNEVLTKRLVIE